MGLLEKVWYFFELFSMSVKSLLRMVVLRSMPQSYPPRTASTLGILGNGPSLERDLLQLDRNIPTDLMCVSHFAKTSIFTELKPNKYIIADGAFGQQYGTTSRVGIIVNETVAALIDKVSWPMELYLNIEICKNKKMIADLKANPFLSIHWFNATRVEGFAAFSHFFYRMGCGMPPCENVLVAALMVAINQRYPQVFLMGADHSWHEGLIIGRNNEMLVNDRHFYNPNGKRVDLTNFNGSYRLHDQFFSLAKTFKSYHQIKAYADEEQVEIVNRSARSFIDAFPRETETATIAHGDH
ncbi:MAG TPA: hypothetical protein VFV37_07805 [Luteibaculaceae bacterium]|nr:hypothetical protein [Luteibaculaceae bacterium]